MAEALEAEAKKIVQGSRLMVAPARLIELHKALIGGKKDSWYCSTCSSKLNSIFWELKYKYFQKPTKMARSTKYRISKAALAANAGIVNIHHKNGRIESIDLNNMTDAQAERIAADKRYKHNVEPIPQKAETKEAETTAKTETTTKKK